MTEGLATILIPVYNGEKYLREMLDSIFNQTYRPLQVIVGNDCSTDNSKYIFETWRNKHISDPSMTIRYIENKMNLGLSKNIVNMIGDIEGEYIFLSDQDDVWKKEKVEKQVGYLKEHPDCMICACDRSITNSELELILESEFQHKRYRIKSMDYEEAVKHKVICSSNCMVIRNSKYLMDYMDIPDNMVMHDTFIAIMASHYGTVDFLFEPLVLYRVHKNNLSGNYGAQFSNGLMGNFISKMNISKRVKKSSTNDGKIIIKELKNRYGIELTDPQNVFVKMKKFHSRLLWAIRSTYREYKKGQIGIWVK